MGSTTICFGIGLSLNIKQLLKYIFFPLHVAAVLETLQTMAFGERHTARNSTESHHRLELATLHVAVKFMCYFLTQLAVSSQFVETGVPNHLQTRDLRKITRL